MKRNTLLWSRAAFAMVVLMAVAAALWPLSAGAATASHLHIKYKLEDAFYNYDFVTTDAKRNKVDWPVDFLYYGNAEIDKVKHRLNWALPYTGSSMYSKLNNGSGWVWDTDKGIKTIKCTFIGDALHTRLYAPPSTDRFYNEEWGFYIIGTSHWDHNECFRGKWSGRSENAEKNVAGIDEREWGSGRVHRNNMWLNNVERYRKVGTHVWENNGWATTVKVP